MTQQHIYHTQSKTTTHIHVGHGVSGNISAMIDTQHVSHVVIVTDQTVGALHADTILSHLKSHKTVLIEIAPGEKSKSHETIQHIYHQLMHEHCDRNTLLIALGGGVVSDVTGFVAATYLRGIDWIAIPTTLLSQVDAAIGGKTGINFNGIKNVIGSFHQPVAVICDTVFLQSLPKKEIASGFAEIIKCAAILDADLFAQIENKSKNTFSDTDLAHIVFQTAQLKAKIVASDTKEITGKRALLNFGHTIGHAIEAVQKGAMTHGASISIGMVAACLLSETQLSFSKKDTSRIIALLTQCNLPTTYEGDIEQIMHCMLHDKKVKNGTIRFVLLDAIGSAQSDCFVDKTIIAKVLKDKINKTSS